MVREWQSHAAKRTSPAWLQKVFDGETSRWMIRSPHNRPSVWRVAQPTVLARPHCDWRRVASWARATAVRLAASRELGAHAIGKPAVAEGD
jgi:hypothetical protein